MNIKGNENYKAGVDYALLQENLIHLGKGAIEVFLRELGFDWNKDPNLKGTPERVARMFVKELLQGNYEPEPKFTIFPNTKKYDQMILLKDIRMVSTCAHHLLPFSGTCCVAYLPNTNGFICGVSKLARIVHWFARRLQIQEELTKQIAEYINRKLKPKGVAVVIEAQHGCMTNRGVMEFNSKMVTSEMLGVFRTKPAARAEFMSLIR